ncbi:HNH endonuclease [Polyangium mundeleinium]|uniref:HNH endonuclease n=1 Tax=Polyangium mundeleinium TaxID=2995306 RepID=A0ABT5F5B1_9BACT|nr:HNH endonuclease [Polyangium mundeleinium]MDC0748809.1 HNH endonuclease [Polyangium mundeleinium]
MPRPELSERLGASLLQTSPSDVGDADVVGGLDELDGSFEIDGDLAFAHPTILSPERRSRDPLTLPVLALNRHFHPVQVTTARRAFLLLFGGAAHAIDEAGEVHDFSSWRGLPVRDSDDGLSIVGGSLRVPRVLHLRRYERVRRPTVRLSRRNVMLRDAHQCQYCLKRPPVRDLNIDHVVPRSRGGVDSWENLVTACRPCNLRKGRRTPEEASMRLLRTPTAPRWSASMLLLLGRPEPFKEWEPFLKSA